MTYNASFFINTHSIKKASLLVVLLLVSLAVSAQVSFSAHVFLPQNGPLDDFSPFCLKVDGEEWWADTTADLFTLWEQQYQENVYAHDYTLGIADEKEEKCVYIQMELLGSFPRIFVGFMKIWDGCDYVVYINLNLEKHEIIRAYPSTCQGY